MTETRGARLLIIGPPGAGKGTQAAKSAERYGVPAISTGDIFRANIKGGTELGQKVQQIIESGELVPDSLTNEIVADRLVMLGGRTLGIGIVDPKQEPAFMLQREQEIVQRVDKLGNGGYGILKAKLPWLRLASGGPGRT